MIKIKSLPIIFLFYFLIQSPVFSEEARHPYVAGTFYPSNKEELSKMLDQYLAEAPAPELEPKKIVALIEPHAGYIYSAKTAAYGYKAIKGLQFDTVILIGPYHKAHFKGASIWKKGDWKTPLGIVSVDTRLAEAITKENEDFGFTQDAHFAEHSLEVQVPFLQKVLKNFKIVPILINDPLPENTKALAEAILKNSKGKKVLVIASTDMSHYHDDATARPMDQETLGFIGQMNAMQLLRGMVQKKNELCGMAATLTVLELSKMMNADIQFLDYTNSGDATGDKTRVVGYSAFAILKDDGARLAVKNSDEKLSKSRQEELLKIAKNTLHAYIKTGKTPHFTVTDPALKKDQACFVTLKKKGVLRGCIGNLLPQEPLYLAVRRMTVQSATKDPRFKPVKPEELKDIEIEISVLSLPKKMRSADEIELGKHGVIVKQGRNQGVFLPQVAGETGWSKEEFLNELCSQKASLPANCWQDPATELYTFTAQDFRE